jgi:hypothetical protein
MRLYLKRRVEKAEGKQRFAGAKAIAAKRSQECKVASKSANITKRQKLLERVRTLQVTVEAMPLKRIAGCPTPARVSSPSRVCLGAPEERSTRRRKRWSPKGSRRTSTTLVGAKGLHGAINDSRRFDSQQHHSIGRSNTPRIIERFGAIASAASNQILLQQVPEREP